ncbi:MAG: magnesium chelatase subunit I [Hyphomicrobiaceae bacterium]|jgi:magnesium chelatase subunit I
MNEARTLGELRASGWKSRGIRAEMRANLLAHLSSGQSISSLFPGIVGYDDSVLPEIENAVLCGHHIVLLGERGQAKTRVVRALVALLDEQIPIVEGSEINDDPLQPVSAFGRRQISEHGNDTPIAWIPRDARYTEKLATPDVTIADLVGEVDPIKIAEGRYMNDEEAIHYGLLPRTHRGIFAINELPDLTEKVQVGLFNVMEERDLQIKGFKVRLPLDVLVVATANPEDYTSRGRIVTPLKDRFDVQIRTHYPKLIEQEIAILDQEVSVAPRDDRAIRVPDFMKEIVARFTMEARSAPEINASSGVSVRVSINNYETLLANAEKRAVRLAEREIVPRISDLHALVASTSGKLELEYAFEQNKENDVVDRLLGLAVKQTFDRRVSLDTARPILEYLGEGWGVAVTDTMPAADYQEGIASIRGLREVIDGIGPWESPGLAAAAAEFVLEGLHLHKKLNRERQGGRLSYGS